MIFNGFLRDDQRLYPSRKDLLPKSKVILGSENMKLSKKLCYYHNEIFLCQVKEVLVLSADPSFLFKARAITVPSLRYSTIGRLVITIFALFMSTLKGVKRACVKRAGVKRAGVKRASVKGRRLKVIDQKVALYL